jgi:hypothetical protein
MAIASFGLSRENLVRRPIVALAALVLTGLTTQRVIENATTSDTAEVNAVSVGEWIRSSAGSDTFVYTDEYLPELDLAARARMPGRASLLPFTQERFAWTHRPLVIVFGPSEVPPIIRQGKSFIAQNLRVRYVPVCVGRTGYLIVYTLPSNVKLFRCTGTTLVFGSRN